jgi:plasmid replication initiation protein
MAEKKKNDVDPGRKESLVIREPMALLVGRKELSIYERRIYWLILRDVKSKQTFGLPDKNFETPDRDWSFSFHYSEIIGQSSHVNDNLKEIFKSAQSKDFLVENKNKPGSWDRVIIFPRAGYESKTGQIVIDIHRMVVSKFLELSSGFSQYSIANALHLKSEYAQALFPMLCNYRKIGKWKISVDELKVDLNIAHLPAYNRYSEFTRRVIDTGLEQINEYTEILVSYETIKVGRQAKWIQFFIEPNVKNIDNNKEILQQRINEVLSLPLDARLKRAIDVMQYYQLDSLERQQIFQQEEYLNRFLRADCYIDQGAAKTDATAYVRQSVFKSKSKTKSSSTGKES